MSCGQFGSEAILTHLGATQPGAAATITEPGGGLSVLYTSLAASAAAANPTTLDADGNLLFYSAPGPKVVTVGGLSKTVLCVAPSTGTSLGTAITTTNFSITSTPALYSGLSVTALVPASQSIFVEVTLPFVQCITGAATHVALQLLEDGSPIAGSSTTISLNFFGQPRCAVPRITTPGSHTYTVQVACTASSTATSFGSLGSVIFPFLRVVAT